MFLRLYLTELKKTARPKMLIIFGAIAVALMLISLIFYFIVENITIDYGDSFGGNGEGGNVADNITIADAASIDTASMDSIYSSQVNLSKEDCETLLPMLQKELNDAQKAASEDKYGYYSGVWTSGAGLLSSLFGESDPVYSARARYNVVKYIDDNGYYNRTFVVYSSSGSYASGDSGTAEDIMTMMHSMLAAVSMVLALVIGARAVSTEIKNGTLKLVFLRPVTRPKFIGAKIAAGFTVVVGFYTVGFLLSTIIGYIAKPASTAEMLFIFNSTDVYTGTASLGIFYTYLFELVTLAAYFVVAFGIGTMTKNLALGIIIPLVMDVVSPLATLAALSRFWLPNVLNWTTFFGYGSSLAGGSHFALTFFVLTIYLVLLGGGTFLTFQKRDIA